LQLRVEVPPGALVVMFTAERAVRRM